MMFTKFTMLLLLCTPSAVRSIQVQSGSDLAGTARQRALQLAQEIAGRGVTIIDARFDSCDDDQVGFFTDADLELGMTFVNGIVLSSGLAVDAAGPNDNVYARDALNRDGYQALTDLLPGGRGTTDACALHVTFDCQDQDHFGLQFVFGSDNYDCPPTPSTQVRNNPYEDVMGIFAEDNPNNATEANIGLYNGQYVSVNTLYSGPDFVNNCNSQNRVEMAGYSSPIRIDNSKNKIVTGRNELWIAVADGNDGNAPVESADMRGPSWLFVRRNSLVCIDRRGRVFPSPNVRTGYRRCAQGALESCRGSDGDVTSLGGCRNWGCLDKYIQSQCSHPGTARADHRRYKQNVHDAIRGICRP
jgi:hypothetical protein